MRALSDSEVLRIWDQGSSRTLLERALLLLGTAAPDVAWDELASLPIGVRDRKLVELRAATFGERMPLSARCPACEEGLEFALTAAQIGWGDGPAGEVASLPLELHTDTAKVRYHLPNSRDLLLVAERASDDAEQALVEACVLDATIDGRSVPAHELPGDLRSLLASAIAEGDPQADITLDLGCPACGQRWALPFDIVTVFWGELSHRAKRLLQEVDALARVYGWREADVLTLSAQRRALYVEMALT